MKMIYFFFFILFLTSVYGFGVSPGSFSIHINNGQEIEKEFFIYNDEDELKTYNISSNGFFNFTYFILGVDGNSEKEVKFLIKVPYETLGGNYIGSIYVNELNKEEGGVNLDTLLGIKFEFFVKSNYTEDFKEHNLKQKLDFNEINANINSEEEVNEDIGFEIILFYILVGLIIILCIYKIYKNIQSV